MFDVLVEINIITVDTIACQAVGFDGNFYYVQVRGITFQSQRLNELRKIVKAYFLG